MHLLKGLGYTILPNGPNGKTTFKKNGATTVVIGNTLGLTPTQDARMSRMTLYF